MVDRDRFVLSNGHASALLYGALHLAGFDLPISQLEQFRQWGSHTPGHPEYGETPGVEVTTGPLGQGLGMAVGLAIAEKHLAAVYNHDNHTPVNHYTYVLCGDGDLMEGISHESCSLAGTLGLGKLIVLYDDNLISLDGPTDLSFTEDVTTRFDGYHWHVQMVEDGNDLVAIEKAILAAKAETTKPTLDSGAHGDRVRKPEGRDPEGAWRGARRRGVEGDQEEPGLARGQDVLRAGCGAEAVEQVQGEGQEGARDLGGEVRGVQEGVPRAGCGVQPDDLDGDGGRLGEGDSGVPDR